MLKRFAKGTPKSEATDEISLENATTKNQQVAGRFPERRLIEIVLFGFSALISASQRLCGKSKIAYFLGANFKLMIACLRESNELRVLVSLAAPLFLSSPLSL